MPKHEIFAPTTELRSVLCYTGVWFFSRNLRQQALSNTADKSLLPVSRVFYDKAGSVPARQHPEHKRTAGGPHIQSIQQPL